MTMQQEVTQLIGSTEQFLTTGQCAKMFPGGVSVVCFRNWLTNGKRLPNGERVFLPHVKLGVRAGIRLTDFQEFVNKVVQVHATTCTPAAPTSGESAPA